MRFFTTGMLVVFASLLAFQLLSPWQANSAEEQFVQEDREEKVRNNKERDEREENERINDKERGEREEKERNNDKERGEKERNNKEREGDERGEINRQEAEERERLEQREREEREHREHHEAFLGKTIKLTFQHGPKAGDEPPLVVLCALREYAAQHKASGPNNGHGIQVRGELRRVEAEDKVLLVYGIEMTHHDLADDFEAEFAVAGSAIIRLGQSYTLGYLGEHPVRLTATLEK